ncbi:MULTISPECIES: amino acid ABC transporter permease [Paenibacillus]|uniref:Cysteine ABC transporter permease n=2 Tax=Paenibacillus naphthalenovorans TaxID=162209 RepID=A0A0U2W7L7_9BACL|nr:MULTISPECIES: amino acid ABC transporter permease [Paenibacillus]ALS23405.1 cysteine ABC transporter permease [Paenibacillus naphthalenovorans]GCL72876.1 amino acid ABC transporter permease [Paenibacillus naphthalenovorans]SDI06662.1 L-cystine transport system permease protein [Paenibacillus naphthalenovorans]
MDAIWKQVIQIAGRLPVTLTMLILSVLFGLLLGLIIALVRIQKRKIPYAIATFYLSFIRCTPTIVQLFLIYYGLPQLLILFGLDVNNWDKIIFAVIAFSLHSAAFFSEVIRSSYLAVGIGQLEAAYSIGMSHAQSLRRIVLPQAFGIAIPNLGNNVIILLKETSLAFSIGITDIMGQVQIMVGNSYGQHIFQMYILVALVYWVISIILEKGFGRLERKYKKGHVSIAK